MTTTNSIVLKAFNKHFFEFIDDIVRIFPDNQNIIESRDLMITLKKANPTLIIKTWQYFIWNPYQDQIVNGDIDFFIEKDYTHDLRYMNNSTEIIKAIETTIRDPLRAMDNTNRIHCIQHLQVVSKLSSKYQST